MSKTNGTRVSWEKGERKTVQGTVTEKGKNKTVVRNGKNGGPVIEQRVVKVISPR